MRTAINTEPTIHHQKAIALVKLKKSAYSEAEQLRIIQELETYKLEMGSQTEALIQALALAAKAKQKYMELYDFAPSGYFTLSKKGEILESNLRGAKMLGRERANLRKAQFGYFISNDSKPNFNLFLRKAFHSLSKEMCELTLYIEGRRPMFVFLSGIVDENGKQCLITVVEIIDRKPVDELLVESVIGNRSLFETSRDGILILDAETGKVLAVNLSASRLLGFSETELIQKELWKIEMFKEIADNQYKFLELQKKKYARYDNIALNTLDDQRVNVEFISKVYLEYKKKVIQCNIHEITNPKQIDLLLVESEMRYRRLFEAVKDGILILDAESGKIQAINPFVIQLLGFPEAKFLDKEVWDIGVFSEIAANKERFAELQQNENVCYDDLSLQTADGRTIVVEFVSNVYVSDKKKVIQFNLRDMTGRKHKQEDLIQAKEKAEERDRQKSSFLANMSHEIRTPINGILGFSELLKEPGLDQEKRYRYIDIIEKSGVRMLNIINDIISISKVDSGQMELSISKTNINEQLDFIQAFFKQEVEQKGIELICEKSLSDQEACINTDREKVYAILTNLVKNAIKFTQSGSIRFGYRLLPAIAKNESAVLEFFVKDTGVGIRPDQLTIVFERFRQGIELLSRSYEGAGLGLSISKAYVEMLGGKIRTESKLGEGSTFYFTLPYVTQSENLVHKRDIALKKIGMNTINNLKILIAEDDENSEMLLELALRKYSVEILKARTGSEAVDICLNCPELDLVLMDIKMPEMDGYEATRQIRDFNKNLVIFAQTAFAQSGDKEIALAAGCNDYISKPINKDSLTTMIQKHFPGRPGIKRSKRKVYS